MNAQKQTSAVSQPSTTCPATAVINSQHIIFSYTRSQAVADGVQVEVTSTAAQAGIRIPVFLTRAVFDRYVALPPRSTINNQPSTGCIPSTLNPQPSTEFERLWDIVCLLRFAIVGSRQSGASRLPFALYVRNDNIRPKLVKLVATCGPLDIDNPQPAITIMLPDED